MDRDFILETIAKEMRTGVVALDCSGKILYANPFFLNSFPVKGEVEGRRFKDITDNRDLIKTVESCCCGGVRNPEEFEVSEKGRVFNLRLVPLKEKGEGYVLLFMRDVTEEKRVETIKKDFVANVSHELRTPLASIKGYSETLLEGGIDGAMTKEFLRVIDRHATRMSRIIDDLLVLSRLESHELPVMRAPVDMKEVILSTKKGFQKEAGDKGIRISANIPEGLPRVLGDRGRLEQVLVNLLDNAVKYTPSGGSVEISASSADGFVRVDVKDTGIGIPKEDLPRIFERFYRVDKARSRELGGTGLGLAIVKHIIQGHDGKLLVESIPGSGSTFSFLLASV